MGGVSILNWRVDEERPIISDHRLITFEIPTEPMKKVADVAIDYKHINWHAFRSFLDQKEWKRPALVNKLWIENEARKFKEDIERALVSSTRTYNRSPRVEKPTYWTQEIDVLRRKMRKHYRVAKETNREQDWTYYRGLRRVFRGEVEKAKVES